MDILNSLLGSTDISYGLNLEETPGQNWPGVLKDIDLRYIPAVAGCLAKIMS
jgi:hypothetical protein